MSIEDVVQAWKSDEDALWANAPANPVGETLSDQELQEISGARMSNCVPEISCANDISCLMFISF